MDPEAALTRIRELVEEIIERGEIPEEDPEFVAITADLGDELATTFQGLDEWIKKGGFLPKDWRRDG